MELIINTFSKSVVGTFELFISQQKKSLFLIEPFVKLLRINTQSLKDEFSIVVLATVHPMNVTFFYIPIRNNHIIKFNISKNNIF